MLRVIENLLRIALLNDLSEVHEYDMVGYSLSLTQRVSHHHNAIILLQLHKKILHRLARNRVKRAGRFVGQQVAGLHCQAACQAETLLLTAAKLVGRRVQAVLHLIPQADSLQIVTNDDIKLLLATNTMYATPIGYIVVNADRLSEDVYASACKASPEAMRLQTKQPRLV